MHSAERLLAVVITVAFLTACGGRKGFDEMGLIEEEAGEVPRERVLKPPSRTGDITTWRTDFPGQVFAAVKTVGPCPRDIHTFAGMEFKKDRIELCWSATPRDEPVPGFPCSTEVYVKYELMRMPPDVQPTFVFVGACPGIAGRGPSR